MLVPRHLRSIPAYLGEVAVRSKIALGGGSLAILLLSLYQGVSEKTVPWYYFVAVVVASVVFAQFWHGLMQFNEKNPPFQIGYPKQQFWNEAEKSGPVGMGYYFEVFNPSDSRSLRDVGAELVAIDPPDIGNLPVPLHIRHKNYTPHVTEVNLAPLGTAGFDLATGPDHNNGSQRQVLIPCVMAGANGVVPAAQISRARHHLTIRVKAEHYSRDIEFDIWVEDGFLRCVPCQSYVLEAQ